MSLSRIAHQSEVLKKRSLLQRMVFVHGFLLVIGLLVVARLMELQIIDRNEYYDAAQSQHFGGVKIPAQRGEVHALNLKTNETTILATNTTLDLLYVDPLIVDDPSKIAESLSDILITEEYHAACSTGDEMCPKELINFSGSPYAAVYDPMQPVKDLVLASGSLLEPIPDEIPRPSAEQLKIPDQTEVRRLFARDIEKRISEKKVTFVPLKYNATKEAMVQVSEFDIHGIYINENNRLIFGNPEEIAQSKIKSIARQLAPVIGVDSTKVAQLLRSRPLRYVPIMRKMPPALSLKVKELKLQSIKETNAQRTQAYESKDAAVRRSAEKIQDPYRSVAMIDEHWRYYPDGTIASHIVGFVNTNQEAQYGIERTFDAALRGQEGLISTVSDPHGGQILTADQTIIDPKDGDSIILTIDPFVQKEVERILEKGVKDYEAESAQAIVMDPFTGRIIAMANAPLFERNDYAHVYEKEPVFISTEEDPQIVVEIFHPVTNARIIKDYKPKIFSEAGRMMLSEKMRQTLADAEKMYDLEDLARFYMYEGENTRVEIFPTEKPNIWLKYKNNIGVGAYLNRTVQEIYEPGSVMKPITMAIALDQGEVSPGDIYDDTGPVKVDEFEIKNALLEYYGKVTMTDCLAQSINTCMTSVSQKLGRKLFHRMLERFGFGHVTGIELEDELSGEVRPWRRWSNADLATASFGQGFSATPLQVITAFAALANGGKLVRPQILDRVVHPDGTVQQFESSVIDQVIRPETSETITAMLTASAEYGFANKGKVKGYKLAGKTGTSQIAGPGGRYESGTGSTINTFMGYAPPTSPRFILLVKYDRPSFSYRVFSEATAAPTFREISAFLFKYYGIPPDEK